MNMFMPTTTTRQGTAIRKPFAWSYSKLKNFEACPKRHYHIDIAKDAKEEYSEQLAYGDVVHKVLAQRIGSGTELPPVHAPTLEPWVQWFLDGPADKILVEQQWAITKDYAPTTWFGKDAWYRAIADAVKIKGPVAIAVDWKTGKIVEDSVQLYLTAATMFAHFPELQQIRSVYVWLKEDAKTIQDVKRSELPGLWAALHSRIEALRQAHELQNYPPTPNRLCRSWCPVKQCPHHGKGA